MALTGREIGLNFALHAISERTGKPDTRGAYGLLGTEMLGALMHLQHARGKHVVFVAILDEKIDDFNRKVFMPQIEGSKTALELPGIVDPHVVTCDFSSATVWASTGSPSMTAKTALKKNALTPTVIGDAPWCLGRRRGD